MQDPPQIITKVYDFLLYLVPQVGKFPRSQKFSLGERLESASFDVLEILLDAWYSQTKLPLLRQANIKLEKIRYYIRLCKDLKCKRSTNHL